MDPKFREKLLDTYSILEEMMSVNTSMRLQNSGTARLEAKKIGI